MPCKGGYRQRIEDGKKRREQERLYEKSPERQYWLALVNRVHRGGGFESLAAVEKTYYSVACLMGEVYNGGFYQFFWNHSGAYYGHAVDGPMEMAADESLQLAIRAKELLFGNHSVPIDVQARRESLPELKGLDAALDSVDKPFWEDPDKLGERCEAFARKHGLY